MNCILLNWEACKICILRKEMSVVCWSYPQPGGLKFNVDEATRTRRKLSPMVTTGSGGSGGASGYVLRMFSEGDRVKDYIEVKDLVILEAERVFL